MPLNDGYTCKQTRPSMRKFIKWIDMSEKIKCQNVILSYPVNGNLVEYSFISP